MDAFALHKRSQSVGLYAKRRYTIVAHQRIRQCHQLPRIRRVGQTLRITGHGSIEHYFTCHGLFVTERLTVETAPVVKDQSHILHSYLFFI